MANYPIHFSLGQSITLSAAKRPDAPSFLFPDGSHHTFAQTNARVNRLVSALRAQGIGRGDRLAVFSLDSHRFVEIVLAALKLGAVYVPLNYRLMRNEIDTLVGHAAPVAFFYDERYADLLRALPEAHPSIRLFVALTDKEGQYEDLLATGEEAEPPVVSADDDIIGLVFTSGTTGLPKGVLQSQRMIKAIVTNQVGDYRMRPDDVRYTAAPTFHIAGIVQLLTCIAYGTPSLIVPQFDPRTTLDFLAADKLTAVFLVPTMISTILNLPDVHDHSYDRLRLICYGASAMSPNLLRRALDTFNCDFMNVFAAGTEAGIQAILTPEDHREALAGRQELFGSIGKPSYGVALRLVDEDLNDVPVGQVGEIATCSDTVMDGYLDMPEETERALRGGWVRVGDMAYADEDGYLYLSGRKKDMIVRGGENIYPIEIESVLAEHPAVSQCAVVGVPDEHWSEIVRAWVTLRPGKSATADELAAFAAGRLAKFKVPTDFRFVEALPTNASGKILKRELRKLDRSEHRDPTAAPKTGPRPTQGPRSSAGTSPSENLNTDRVRVKNGVSVTDDSLVIVTVPAEGVLLVTFNRPEVRNALNAAMAERIAEAMDQLDGDPDLRVGVVTGAGGIFSSGMDLKAFVRGERPIAPGRGLAGFAERGPRKPLIAAVEGYALAGGFEVVLACDLIVAAETAKFGIPEVTRGLVAAGGGLLRLPRRIPYHLAMEFGLTGRQVPAPRAYEMGLVNRLVPEGGALDGALQLAEEIQANGPLAVVASKKLIVESRDWPTDQMWELQAEISRPVASSADAREGAVAFSEKRPPVWQGK